MFGRLQDLKQACEIGGLRVMSCRQKFDGLEWKVVCLFVCSFVCSFSCFGGLFKGAKKVVCGSRKEEKDGEEQ